jgi:NAD(P)-dependent dehydrogenase (short-subunit alcohol dehydrogenase family)
VRARAPLAPTKAILPEMMRGGWVRIVNVTTGLGTMPNAGDPAYGLAKAALEALSSIIAKDLDGTGGTVNVQVPGSDQAEPILVGACRPALAAAPTSRYLTGGAASPSSRGPGHRPLTAATPVRIR